MCLGRSFLPLINGLPPHALVNSHEKSNQHCDVESRLLGMILSGPAFLRKWGQQRLWACFGMNSTIFEVLSNK